MQDRAQREVHGVFPFALVFRAGASLGTLRDLDAPTPTSTSARALGANRTVLPASTTAIGTRSKEVRPTRRTVGRPASAEKYPLSAPRSASSNSPLASPRETVARPERPRVQLMYSEDEHTVTVLFLRSQN